MAHINHNIVNIPVVPVGANQLRTVCCGERQHHMKDPSEGSVGVHCDERASEHRKRSARRLAASGRVDYHAVANSLEDAAINNCSSSPLFEENVVFLAQRPSTKRAVCTKARRRTRVPVGGHPWAATRGARALVKAPLNTTPPAAQQGGRL